MNIEVARMIIELFVGLTMLVFGINQMAKPSGWLEFLPEWARKMSPFKPETDMRTHALGNIVFGLFLMFGFGAPLVAAWVAFIWWLSIIPFAWRVSWTVGMRDLCIALSLASLIFLLG